MTTTKRVDAPTTVERSDLMPSSNTKNSLFVSPSSSAVQKEGVGRGDAHAGHPGSEGHRSQDLEVEHQAENDELNTPALTETNPWSLRSLAVEEAAKGHARSDEDVVMRIRDMLLGGGTEATTRSL